MATHGNPTVVADVASPRTPTELPKIAKPPDTAMDIAGPSKVVGVSKIPRPPNLYFATMVGQTHYPAATADDIYHLLDISEDKRSEIIKCTQRVYKECTFPDMSFANVPKTSTAVAIATLRAELSKIYPDSGRAPWFAKWALWWEHTEPVSEPTESRSARLASDVWVLLRVRAQDRRDIIKCIGGIYKEAKFEDLPYGNLPEKLVKTTESKLREKLRATFRDSRRGEPWFPSWALYKRHKTRAESRNRRKRVKSVSDGDDD